MSDQSKNNDTALKNRTRKNAADIQNSGTIIIDKNRPDEKISIYQISIIVLGLVFFGCAMFLRFNDITKLCLFAISYMLVGFNIFDKIFASFLNGDLYDENFLMALATVGAFGLERYTECIAVLLFFQIGELLQERAVNKSQKSISALLDLRPDYANLLDNAKLVVVTPSEVNIGDKIVVKPGERIPLDGVIFEGETSLDVSPLTGEAMRKQVKPGDEILSGTINKGSAVTIRTTRSFAESAVSKILDLVQKSLAKKAKTEKFITEFAKVYTPAVILAAIAMVLISQVVFHISYAESFSRALIFLVAACPCALVISIPLAFFGGLGLASKNGILIKGGKFIEELTYVRGVVFDKTGTFTNGKFEVREIVKKSDVSENDMLRIAAHADAYSNHLIAVSIRRRYSKEIDHSLVTQHNEMAGFGVNTVVEGKKVYLGNTKLMEKIGFKLEEDADRSLHIAVENQYLGYFVISDEIRKDGVKTIQQLKKMGIRTLLFTGDKKSIGDKIGSVLGIDEIVSELLPQDKVAYIEKYMERPEVSGKVAFVGDGINDAPVIARADVGVAMGGVGSDAAIEAADIVLMTDEPSKIIDAIMISHKTRGVVNFNILLSLAVKLAILCLGAFGIIEIWEAVLADACVTILAISNAVRLINIKINKNYLMNE